MRPNRHQSQSSRRQKPRKSSHRQTLAEILPLESRLLMSAVPAFSSRPGAAQKLYLDFDGDNTANWGSYQPGSTPAYDTDGNPSSFSAGEISNIQQIWARVVEKYSPFNIDVTTIDPGAYNDHQAFRVVIGGAGAWAGGGSGGITWINSYNNSMPNTGYVFSANLANGNPRYVGDAAAHEAGHGFGLSHQSSYSGTTKTATYNQGNSATAPLMGNSYYAARGLWWYGQSEAGYNIYQDDLSVLSNSIGYRADDYGNSIATASPLTLSGTSATASGVIEKTNDWDYFSFSTAGGNVSFTANPSTYGGMLDLQLSLYNSTGSLIASANTANLGESVSAYVAAGTYYVAVGSHGSYGDVGQYSLSGTVGSAATGSVPAGTKLAGTPIGTAGSWNNSGNTFTYALDGNINTFFDAPVSDYATVGYDLGPGNARVITAVRYAPRTGQSGRMIGGQFQGSNDGSTWSTLYTVNSQPPEGQYTTANVGSSTAFRYVRYQSPAGGWGNVADVEFYSAATPVTNLPPTNTGGTSTNMPSGTQVRGTAIGTAGSLNNSGNTFYKAFDGNLNTYFDAPTSQAWVGIDFESRQTVSSARFAPRTGQAGRMVGGQFQASNDGSTWTTVATLTSPPAEGQYTTINFAAPGSYRYVRYLSPDGGYGNIAEFQIYSGTAAAEPIVITAPPTAEVAEADPTPIFCANPIQSDLLGSDASHVL